MNLEPQTWNVVGLFASDAQSTLWQRLDEATRGRLALTLAAFVLLAGLLILMVALSARMMRRIARHRPASRPREVSDWDRKDPLEPLDEGRVDE